MEPGFLFGGVAYIQLADWPYLDTSMFRRRDAARDLNRFVEILRIDKVEARKLLLGL
ncbi:MAG: hypothetical protein JWQ55_1897, partial [Rhodopila sp.]|nr:hypothetical protein [Rhodopila sp.]